MMTNGLPVDRQTFVGADEVTYRGLQYDLFKELYRRVDERPQMCDARYVRWQWVRERKLFVAGVVLGVCAASSGFGVLATKLLAML